ncbi:MAG: pyridoxal-phosphate dependent enzyme [Candidatus Eisenbacteria bacterium]|nr:pyridoxal-phosphate dependent enzyme [Candidatus Latescibacterota bacterium]MBD3303148.1 pyridoxal-phosphate dependent enzyme [Candidatus Eisenbacteria bacterium]
MARPTLPYPPRISLGRFPTPVEPLARLRLRPGAGTVWIKRDDLSGTALSGNKIRKLEFLLADALERRCDVVLTCGGIQSNHARATAVAARRLGLDSLLLLRGEAPPIPDGNVLLDRLAGAEIVFISPEEYADRRALLAREAKRLEAEGRRPYVIPEGGSNALGAWGYVAMLEELWEQGVADPIRRLFFATGSAGTLAGLHLGKRLLDLPLRIEGVAVCDNEAYFRDRVLEICTDFVDRFGAGTIPDREEIHVIEGYRGPGYAKTYPRLLDLVRRVAGEEGLFLDPVYTGKAFLAMADRLADGTIPPEEEVGFLHTGGIFSLFAYREELYPPATPPSAGEATEPS